MSAAGFAPRLATAIALPAARDESPERPDVAISASVVGFAFITSLLFQDGPGLFADWLRGQAGASGSPGLGFGDLDLLL